MENEPLGKGFFGEVFRGEVTGLLRGSVSSLHSPVKASVAVKRLKSKNKPDSFVSIEKLCTFIIFPGCQGVPVAPRRQTF